MLNIKKMRENKQLTQRDLSVLLGLKQSTIAMWETGRSMPASALLPRLAEILGCKIDDLFERWEEMR